MRPLTDLIPTLFFLLGGLVFLILIVTKYTEEAHEKELTKNNWMKRSNDKNVIFYWLMSRSYIITKILLIIAALIPLSIGILMLWGMF